MSGRNWRGKNEAEKGEKYKSTDPNADPEKHFSFFRGSQYTIVGVIFMPMSTLLAKAFEEASQLPEEEQDAVAELVISFIHPDEADEAEWDALVRSPESQRFIDKMVSNSERRKKKKVSFHFLATSEVKSHPPVLEALR